jgi:hypothetical protein
MLPRLTVAHVELEEGDPGVAAAGLLALGDAAVGFDVAAQGDPGQQAGAYLQGQQVAGYQGLQ